VLFIRPSQKIKTTTQKRKFPICRKRRKKVFEKKGKNNGAGENKKGKRRKVR
jgi:hypothetical protein